MASSCTRKVLDWILGKYSYWKSLSSIWAGCPGKHWNHHAWNHSKGVQMRQVRALAEGMHLLGTNAATSSGISGLEHTGLQWSSWSWTLLSWGMWVKEGARLGLWALGEKTSSSSRRLSEGLALKKEQVEQSWQIKEIFKRVQVLAIPRCKKWDKKGRREAWTSKDLLVKLKGMEQMHREWEQRQAPWEG